MLVAGHETTGSVLTWTSYLLSKVSPVDLHPWILSSLLIYHTFYVFPTWMTAINCATAKCKVTFLLKYFCAYSRCIRHLKFSFSTLLRLTCCSWFLMEVSTYCHKYSQKITQLFCVLSEEELFEGNLIVVSSVSMTLTLTKIPSCPQDSKSF